MIKINWTLKKLTIYLSIMPRKRRKKNKSNKSYELINLGKWTDDNTNRYLLGYNNNLDLIDIENQNESDKLFDMRKSADVHRSVRKYAQENLLKPGIKLIDICNGIENKIVELFGGNNKDCGIGFPVGLSINNIAAHDSANPNDNRVLQYGDVCKVDFGTHVNGWITDSAFTVAFDPKFKPLLNASKDGTWTGIKLAGPDARINEISEGIQEIIESYEIELDGKIYPIQAIKNLGGHNIKPYKIHADKLVLCAPDKNQEDIKMDVGECFAIETFASTGLGFVNNEFSMKCNHYMKNYNPSFVDLKFNTSKKLLNYINKSRSTLPFCTRWINNNHNSRYETSLSELVNKGIVEMYPPLVDESNSYTSQLEHTIYLHEYGKEILSKGNDY